MVKGATGIVEHGETWTFWDAPGAPGSGIVAWSQAWMGKFWENGENMWFNDDFYGEPWDIPSSKLTVCFAIPMFKNARIISKILYIALFNSKLSNYQRVYGF